MASWIDMRSLEATAGIWKARALAKQEWLEQALTKPTANPQEAARRMAWVRRALKVVKRAQSRVRYQTRLIDVYAQHLNAVEMTLMSEVERNTRKMGAEPGARVTP